MLSTVEVLRKARKLLSKGWTRYASARTKRGTGTLPTSSSAQSWCALGALAAVTPRNDVPGPGTAYMAARKALRNTLKSRGLNEDVVSFNDNDRRTQLEVLELFDEAIAREESGAV